MNITTVKTQEDFRAHAEQAIADAINAAIATHGACALGLSGGSTPGPIYAALGKRTDIDWHKVTVVLIDERYVPADHPDSNYGMIERTLLVEGSHAHKARFVAPDTDLPLEACVPAFAQALEDITFDLVVLGMGDDGHIASLFPPLSDSVLGPARAAHTTTDRFAVFNRITVSLPMLKEARQRVLLVTGKAKMDVLKKVQGGHAADLPIAKVSDELEVIAMV
jgi:6-phosphogluconolactonase